MVPTPARQRQRGTTAIEFALTFTVLFGIFWGIISYSLPFYMLHVMNRAVAEAARNAVRADPQQSDASYQTKLVSLATTTLTTQLNSLPPAIRSHLQPYGSNISIVTDTGVRYLVVRLVYANYGTNPIVPALTLPLLGKVPNLPGNLTAEARLRI